MTRKRIEWKLKQRSFAMGERTLIAGILNVTPDSFSDGGRYQEPDRAYARALELEDQGADIIDIGAESTRPGSSRISEGEEIRRLIPVLKRLAGALRIPICVDTYKASVAERALETGAEIINDPSGLTFDPTLAKVVVKYDAGLILNHMRGTPETWAKLAPVPDITGMVATELQATVHRAMRSGVNRNQIVVDPGLGFGKRKEQNTVLLARLPQIVRLGYPLMVGPSRKSFLAKATELETSYANAAAVTASVLAGAHMVRVHEVAEMRIAAQLADQIIEGLPEID
jgi:dihydropteroate synthase